MRARWTCVLGVLVVGALHCGGRIDGEPQPPSRAQSRSRVVARTRSVRRALRRPRRRRRQHLRRLSERDDAGGALHRAAAAEAAGLGGLSVGGRAERRPVRLRCRGRDVPVDSAGVRRWHHAATSVVHVFRRTLRLLTGARGVLPRAVPHAHGEGGRQPLRLVVRVRARSRTRRPSSACVSKGRSTRARTSSGGGCASEEGLRLRSRHRVAVVACGGSVAGDESLPNCPTNGRSCGVGAQWQGDFGSAPATLFVHVHVRGVDVPGARYGRNCADASLPPTPRETCGFAGAVTDGEQCYPEEKGQTCRRFGDGCILDDTCTCDGTKFVCTMSSCAPPMRPRTPPRTQATAATRPRTRRRTDRREVERSPSRADAGAGSC